MDASRIVTWRGERVPISPDAARVLFVPDDAALVRLESDGEPVLERVLPPAAEGPDERRIELSLP